MSLSITINTSDGLSAQDLVIIAAISSAAGGKAPDAAIQAEAAELAAQVSKPAAKKTAPAKKAAAAKAEEPDEPEADEDGPTLADAIQRAVDLMAEGNKPAVKEALDEIGAERVKALKGAQIAQFLELTPEPAPKD